MPRVAALIPDSKGHPSRPPEELPLGRGALLAAKRGVDVVFGEYVDDQGRLGGLIAVPGGWQAVRTEVDAVFDRFRDQLHPERYGVARRALGSLPWGNQPEAIALCRDKLASQRLLEAGGVPMPELVVEDFDAALGRWGQGFLKPRYGSFGRGVRLVRAGEETATRGEGMRPGDEQQLLLQRAVAPPSGLAGLCVRALVQRVEGRWICRTPAARSSVDDAVVNVARGAGVASAASMLGPTLDIDIREVAVRAAEALGEGFLEVGVDLVVDPAGTVWVIEVNGRPRGRLGALAALDPDLAREHVACCAAPFLELARGLR